MNVKRLDHIALYMNDRDEAARFLTTHLGFHIVDHTERYTLVGAGGRLGKLTLFDAPQGTTPSPGEIERITIRVANPEAAARELRPRLMPTNHSTAGTPLQARKDFLSPCFRARESSRTTTSKASPFAPVPQGSRRTRSSR